MKLLQELLLVTALAAVCMVAIIVAVVRLFRWLELFLLTHRKVAPHTGSSLYHDDEWDFMVDGSVIASLVPAGPPEDPNTSFIIFDVMVVPGHEPEAENWLHQFNQRDPNDERICFRSRTREGVTLKDSQVLGAMREDGRRFAMKAYPPEPPSKPLTDRHGPPHNPETPERHVG